MWSAYSGGRIYLDANAVIYIFETGFQWSRASKELMAALDRGDLSVVTSEITIAEVMVKPLQVSDASALAAFGFFFSHQSGLELVSVSRQIVLASARASAAAGIKLVDAIHVASAELGSCGYFLTHDERLGRALPSRMKWLRFSDIA